MITAGAIASFFLFLSIGSIVVCILLKFKRDIAKLNSAYSAAASVAEDEDLKKTLRDDQAVEYLSGSELRQLHEKGAVTIDKNGSPMTIVRSDKWKK